MAHKTTVDGTAGTKSSVKGKTATNPGSGEDAGKAEVGSLEGVDKWLPGSSTAEGGGTEEEGSLEFGIHVDRAIIDCLLGTVVEAMASEHTNTVTDTGGEGKIHSIGGEAKVVLGDDGGSLPSETCRENLGNSHFGCHDKPINNAATWGFYFSCRRRIRFCHGGAVDLSAILLLLVEGRRRCHGRHQARHAIVAVAERLSMKEDTGCSDGVHDGHWMCL